MKMLVRWYKINEIVHTIVHFVFVYAYIRFFGVVLRHKQPENDIKIKSHFNFTQKNISFYYYIHQDEKEEK